MRNILIAFLLTLSFGFAKAQEFPAKPDKLVNDYTGTLTSAQTAQLESKLVAFNDSTSTQIAVAIVKSVGDYDINEYTLELGRKWGVGSGKKNNGIMIVVALGDRKISIQTGYGLEGALPDIYTNRIIENDFKPFFKAGDYYSGIEAGTNSIMQLVKGEYKGDGPKKQTGVKNGAGIPIIIIIIVIIFLILRRGGGSGGSQVMGGRGVANALFWSMLFSGGGRGSGGSGFGGGGSSGGGGGFSGFGGGSFGGGGSSGSW